VGNDGGGYASPWYSLREFGVDGVVRLVVESGDRDGAMGWMG
jgi:hypothetical protein